MKKILNLRIVIALLLLVASMAATAQTTNIFVDNFTAGSTVNSATPANATNSNATYYNSTAYEQISAKPWLPNPAIIAPNDLRFGIGPTTSGTCEIQALFATNAIAMTQIGDFLQMTVVFTNTQGVLAQTCQLGMGMYNSGQVKPMPGGTNNATTTPPWTGNAQNWQGYVGQVYSSGNKCQIATRPMNTSVSTANNQDLVTSGSSSSSYSGSTTVGTTYIFAGTLNNGSLYTNVLTITFNSALSLAITNTLYDSSGNVVTNFGGIATNATFLTSAFDALAIGFYAKANTYSNILDISSISIVGHSSPPVLPTITSQPKNVIVATNGTAAFNVVANGVNLTYQWHRNNSTNFAPNMSAVTGPGAASSTLLVSSCSNNDVFSTNNGYFVTVTGAGGLSTNSVTNSLTLIPVTNLYYATGTWDVHNSASWDITDSGAGHYVFDYGDPVIFGNNGGGNVALNDPNLTAASVTVSQSAGFLTWTAGSGSFAGPGNLICNGTAQFTINNANTFSGGTFINNAGAKLRLGNLNGLGTGPITNALAGGKMEILTAGSASTGVPNDVVVNDDFTIQYDGLGSYAAVFNGNLSGTAGKNLTFLEAPINNGSGTNNRVRILGGTLTNNANIIISDSETTLAPYNTSGFQVYNGVISGDGTVEEKGYAIFNNANTYSGGLPGGMYLAAGNTGLGISSTGSPGAPTSGPLGVGTLLLWVDSTGNSPANSAGIYAFGGARTLDNAIQYPSSTNNLTLTVNGTNDLTFTGPITLNGNDAFYTNTPSANMVLYSNRTFQVTNTGLTTFSGVLSDMTNGDSGPVSAGMGVIKTGNGVLVLASGATETYTGPTAVLGGTLQVNATLDPASAVTVSNGILSGTGNVNGTVFVNTNGTLAPGAVDSIGTLTLNNGLTNSGNIKVKVNHTASTSDKAFVTGALTNNGTGSVIVTNMSGTLVLGDTFFLFNKALSNGAAMTVLGGNVAWNNKLAIDGSIQVIASPDIGVQETGAAAVVALGLNMTNTITVTNLGPGSAYGIVVTNVLPNNATYVSNIGGGTTNANPGQVVWSGITLALNSYSNLTLVLRTTASGNATNIVSTVSSAADPAPANNVATNITSVVQAIDIGVTNTGPANVSLGSPIAYTVTVTNIGPGTASGIIVTDSLSPKVTFVSADNGGTTNGTLNMRAVIWSGFNLAVNTKTNFTLNVIGAVGGNATNVTAVVGSTLDTNLVNNTASWVTVIPSTIIPQVSAGIGTITMNGLNVVISGTNGVDGGTYYLLDTTNVAKPLVQWLSVATNVVNTNGNSGAFTFRGTNVVDPNGAQQFYILSNTNNH